MTNTEYPLSKWEQAFIDKGHDPYMIDYEGKTDPRFDVFRVDEGYHNGPECKKCGWSCCMHCVSAKNIPECDK